METEDRFSPICPSDFEIYGGEVNGVTQWIPGEEFLSDTDISLTVCRVRVDKEIEQLVIFGNSNDLFPSHKFSKGYWRRRIPDE